MTLEVQANPLQFELLQQVPEQQVEQLNARAGVTLAIAAIAAVKIAASDRATNCRRLSAIVDQTTSFVTPRPPSRRAAAQLARQRHASVTT